MGGEDEGHHAQRPLGLRLLGERCLHADFPPNPSSYLTMLWYPLDFDLLTACFLSNVYLMLIKPTAGPCVHDLCQGGAPGRRDRPSFPASCSAQSPSTSHPPCGEKLARDCISGVHSTPQGRTQGRLALHHGKAPWLGPEPHRDGVSKP